MPPQRPRARSSGVPAVGAVSGLAVVSVMFAGCLSPKTLAPVATQNDTNIANYTANVERLAAAFEQSARLQMELELHLVRKDVANVLARLAGTVLVDDPDSSALGDITRSWHVELQKEVAALRTTLAPIAHPGVRDEFARRHGPVFDLAINQPGLDGGTVIRDAVRLAALDTKITNETDPRIRAVFFAQQHDLLAKYSAVKQQTHLNRIYAAALADYVATLREQGEVARRHAGAIVGYAQAQPEADSLAGAGRDEDLRRRVLELVAAREGEETAERLRQKLRPLDAVWGVLDELRGN